VSGDPSGLVREGAAHHLARESLTPRQPQAPGGQVHVATATM